jgi:hypothetical protein
MSGPMIHGEAAVCPPNGRNVSEGSQTPETFTEALERTLEEHAETLRRLGDA